MAAKKSSKSGTRKAQAHDIERARELALRYWRREINGDALANALYIFSLYGTFHGGDVDGVPKEIRDALIRKTFDAMRAELGYTYQAAIDKLVDDGIASERTIKKVVKKAT